MQCSSLNHHLYRKNIVDSPNCFCGSTESTAHYLFHCLLYTAQRQMYINSFNVPINLTTEILLFGSPKFVPNQNVELFLAVQFFLSVVSDSHLKVFCLCLFFFFSLSLFFFLSCALLFHHLVLLSIWKFSHLYLFRITLFFIIVPSPTKLRRDIPGSNATVRPSFRNILVNTLESTSFNGFWPNLVHA
jgi:hypothetical protein